MIDVTKFGSADMPLRASTLPRLARCSFSAVIASLQDDVSGPAADTGSAVHFAIAEWHKDKDSQRAIREMRKAINTFQFADLDIAESHFRAYTQDPRNVEAEIVGCEVKETLTLKAHETDPTQADIVVNGTIDQIRVDNGLYFVWDVKTGKAFDGFDMLHHHCLQLAAYQAMASKHYPIHGCGVIRTQDYFKRAPGPAFWLAPWTMRDVVILLDTVRLRVAEIRRGHIALSPDAKSCDYCPAKCLSNCLPIHREYHAAA